MPPFAIMMSKLSSHASYDELTPIKKDNNRELLHVMMSKQDHLVDTE